MLKHELVKEILITKEQIQKRIAELAIEIQSNYQNNDQPLVLLGILRGCLPFISDFMMNLEIECVLEFMYVASYGDKTVSIEPEIKFDIFGDIKNRDVLIVEDIIDSGKTLIKLIDYLKQKQPKSIKVVTLLDKKARRIAEVTVDWSGFEVPDYFLVGYGLDYDERLRNLPYIAIPDFEKIQKLENKS